MFPRIGIDLLAPTAYFFYSPSTRKLRLEEVILHSLLVPGRTVLPILLAWKKNERKLNLQSLEELAERYGAQYLVTRIAQYFATQGRQPPVDFPSWDEFIVRAKEYGIT